MALIESKCALPSCGKTIIVHDYDIKRNRGLYCDLKCRSKVVRTYTEDKLKYVMDNIVSQGYDGCAKHLGINEVALKRQISKWRDMGHAIPYLRTKSVGYSYTTEYRGAIYRFIKTESGWSRELVQGKPRVKKEKPPKPPKIKQPRKNAAKLKPVKPPKIRKLQPQRKADVRRLPDRVINASEMKYVRIDAKTLIQVPKNVDNKIAIENYLKKRAS